MMVPRSRPVFEVLSRVVHELVAMGACQRAGGSSWRATALWAARRSKDIQAFVFDPGDRESLPSWLFRADRATGSRCWLRAPTTSRNPEQFTQPTHRTQSVQPTQPIQATHRVQARHARQARQPRAATHSTISTLPATPALPAVATEPATATLPAVATEPATATLPAVATEPATATLPAWHDRPPRRARASDRASHADAVGDCDGAGDPTAPAGGKRADHTGAVWAREQGHGHSMSPATL